MIPVLLTLLFAHRAVVPLPAPLRVTADDVTLSVGQGAFIEIQNTSNETVHDVSVMLTLPQALQLGPDPFAPQDWTCSRTSTGAVCTIADLPAHRRDFIAFTPYALDGTGGHYIANVAVRARDAAPASIAFDYVAGHFTSVNTTADSGPGSLRALIEEANANPLCGTDVPCLIAFFGVTPPVTIAPLTPLPAIEKCNVTISGHDAYETPNLVKEIALSGENVREGNGLEVRATCAKGVPGVLITGLAIHSWPENGIRFFTPAPQPSGVQHTVHRCYVGTDATGTIAMPNGLRGIGTYSPFDAVTISDGVASGNARSGIAFWAGARGFITTMKIGVDRDGKPLGNGASGVFSQGVPFTLTGSTIAFNKDFGVAIAKGTPMADVHQNAIHDNTGLAIDWGLDGRTLPDDETDGILNTPQIIDSFYDAAHNETIIRGSVRLRGGKFTIEPYEATSLSGDVLRELPANAPIVTAPAGAVVDLPFEVRAFGDLRGKLVAVQTLGNGLASEISEAALVK